MGTRTAVIRLGCIISFLVTLVPREAGGLGLLSVVPGGWAGFKTLARAVPADDLYLDFDPGKRRLLVISRGQIFFECEARNDTIRPGSYGHFGHCPPGWFAVGAARARNTVKLGPYFLPLSDVRGETVEMKRFRREAIGIHGGGTGLPAPLAPRQGWKPTLGCIRLQNQDLRSLVSLVAWARARGGRVWIRVGANPRVR